MVRVMMITVMMLSHTVYGIWVPQAQTRKQPLTANMIHHHDAKLLRLISSSTASSSSYTHHVMLSSITLTTCGALPLLMTVMISSTSSRVLVSTSMPMPCRPWVQW
jgi:hypothetical protein